jgi:hypothetical protein
MDLIVYMSCAVENIHSLKNKSCNRVCLTFIYTHSLAGHPMQIKQKLAGASGSPVATETPY